MKDLWINDLLGKETGTTQSGNPYPFMVSVMIESVPGDTRGRVLVRAGG